MTRKKIISITTLFLFIGSLFLTIGYAQVAYDLSVSGNISMNSQNGVVIKNVTEAAKVGTNTSGTIKNYVATTLTNAITLDENGSSYIIYAVQVENTTSSLYKFTNVLPDISSMSTNIDTYTNRFIKPTILTTSEVASLFPSATNVIGIDGQIPGSSTRNVYVKFEYDSSIINNGTVSSDYQTLATGLINLRFKKVYSITYANITGSYTNQAVDSEAFSVNFGANAPAAVTVTNANNQTLVSGTDYTYNNGIISFQNGITSNITITGVSGGVTGSGTPDDPYIDTTVTQYDIDDIEPGTTVQYPLVEGNPIITKDDNGKISSFEFDLGTNETVTLDNGESVETGIIAFDGTGFTIHLKIKTTLPDNVGKFYLTALQQRSGGTYDGIALYVANPNKLTYGTYVNRARAGNGRLTANYTGTLANTSNADVIFDTTIVYNPTGYQGNQPQLTASTVNFNTNKIIRGNSTVPSNLTNATFTLGGNGLDHADDVYSMEVLEFSITKNY